MRDPAKLLRLAATNKNAAKLRGGDSVFPPDEPPPSAVVTAPIQDDFAAPIWVGGTVTP